MRRLLLLPLLLALASSAADPGLAALAELLKGVGQAAQQQEPQEPQESPEYATPLDPTPYCRDPGDGTALACWYSTMDQCYRAVRTYGGSCVRKPESAQK